MQGRKTPKPKVIVRFVVPRTTDGRSYQVKWNDLKYLDALALMSGSDCFVEETQRGLEEMRNVKDAATTPDELKGINACLKIMKRLAICPAIAQNRAAAIRKGKEMEQEEDVASE